MFSEPLLPQDELVGEHSATPEGFHHWLLQMTSLRTFGSARSTRWTGESCFLAVCSACLAGYWQEAALASRTPRSTSNGIGLAPPHLAIPDRGKPANLCGSLVPRSSCLIC